jgi:hypothetical protein
VVLVVDFAAFDASTRELLRGKEADAFPDDLALLRRFERALRKSDEVVADRLVRSKREQARLDRRLAEVLDRGAFELRSGRPSKAGHDDRPPETEIIRLDYSYNCGEACGTSGRVFLTRACQELVAVTDWVG